MLPRITADEAQGKLSFGRERQVYRVTELNAAVQRLFETEFESVWVQGEISGCRLAASGHYYFSLKDEQSQIKCALFKGAARFAKFKPQEGLAVILRGRLEVYEARGEYQLIVDLLEPRGAGALQLAFEQLKKKLAAEGLFEASRKRPLPKLPQRIGVVTSLTGAVIRDILHVLERRFTGLHIRVFPAQVQGEGSVEQVSQGIRYFSENGWADVVIVARGGGSLEDLWTFNEERVARAIAASRVPVISAVGHETDFTIADFVADLRAPTPSAAAELVICTRDSLVEQIRAWRAKSVQGIRYRLLISSRDLHRRGVDRALGMVHRFINKQAQRLDELESEMQRIERRLFETRKKRFAELQGRFRASDLRLQVARMRHEQAALSEQLLKAMRTRLWRVGSRHSALNVHLVQLSPLAVLARGYAIVESRKKRIVRSSAEVSTGESVMIRLAHGEMDAIVSATYEEN